VCLLSSLLATHAAASYMFSPRHQHRPSSLQFWWGGRQPSAPHAPLVEEVQLSGKPLQPPLCMSALWLVPRSLGSMGNGSDTPARPENKDLHGSSSKTRYQDPCWLQQMERRCKRNMPFGKPPRIQETQRAVDPPRSTLLLGRPTTCSVSLYIHLTSRATGPLKPCYHATFLQVVSPGFPKDQQSILGEKVRSQKSAAPGFSAEIHHEQGATASSICVIHPWQSPSTFNTSDENLTLS